MDYFLIVSGCFVNLQFVEVVRKYFKVLLNNNIMNHTDLQKMGGEIYIAPECEFVELGAKAAICQASYDIEDWKEDESGLEF